MWLVLDLIFFLAVVVVISLDAMVIVEPFPSVGPSPVLPAT